MATLAPVSALDTIEGELAFFRAICYARPIGKHRHFHVLSIRNAVHNDTGYHASIEEIWTKLKSCYDIDVLENIDLEAESYGSDDSHATQEPQSPAPDQNLAAHPFFIQEYQPPVDETFEAICAKRRVRNTPSPPTSPPPIPPPSQHQEGKRRGGRKNYATAGLVGGDSDSSALTQDSADDDEDASAQATGTDGGSDGEEDADMQDASPAPSATKATRARTKAMKKGAPAKKGPARGGTKKRKR